MAQDKNYSSSTWAAKKFLIFISHLEIFLKVFLIFLLRLNDVFRQAAKAQQSWSICFASLIECVPSRPCSSAQTAKARQCASNPHGRPARLPPLLRRRGRRTHRHALAQGQRASAGQPRHRGQPSGPRFDPPGESADGRAYGQLQLPGGQLCRLGRHFLLCPSEGYVRERSRLLVLLLLLVCTGEHSHGKYALVRPQV